MEPLYEIVQVDIADTTRRRVVYGHVTENVVQDYACAYVNEDRYVEIRLYKEKP